nr:MAG TPA: protein of unknown function (DUF4615) [Caudoviricetes sp.]
MDWCIEQNFVLNKNLLLFSASRPRLYSTPFGEFR